MNASQIPAGLIDSHFELFQIGSETFALNNGKRLSYHEFPLSLLKLLDKLILERPKVSDALNELGIFEPDQRRKQFIRCNLSNFDFNADISECLTKVTTEYVNCSIREFCSYEGRLCSGIQAPNGKASLRELRIMGLIRQGFYDKEICDMLNIAHDTLKSTKKNIQRKFKVERKAMIASMATSLQIR